MNWNLKRKSVVVNIKYFIYKMKPTTTVSLDSRFFFSFFVLLQKLFPFGAGNSLVLSDLFVSPGRLF